MKFDMRTLPMPARYKIMNGTVTPRPIAWVTTVSEDGVVNAAPYSFFNCVGIEPPLLVLGLLKDPITRQLKDTAYNIVRTGEFVVNLVGRHDAERMNLCSAEVPRGISEIDYAGIETLPSETVTPPRIASSPVSFECRKVTALDIGTLQTVMIGEVLMAHIADDYVTDVRRTHFDTQAMDLIGRTHGGGWYVGNGDSFQMERPTYDPELLPAGAKQD